jgi:arsenite/tail-anchored protein-transporting ATPase
MDLARLATRHLFFTGKGGVGKTSVACSTAIGLADARKRVLLVSTDPASNLDEVLGVSLGTRPTAVPGVPGLSALNLDPEAAAHAYRERVVGPYRDLLPPAAVRSMEEQLSGACTVEIAAFNEFARLLGDPAATPNSITSSSTPRRRGTRCDCSPFPRPGLDSWSRARSGRAASGRSRDWRSSGRSTRTP